VEDRAVFIADPNFVEYVLENLLGRVKSQGLKKQVGKSKRKI
jgi:hypothetical protein